MAFTVRGHGVGLRNVGSYQISGHPYLTGTADMGTAPREHKIEFPFVTKSITVIASGSAGQTAEGTNYLRVHFNAESDGEVLTAHHFITLDSDEDSITFDVKCKEIYLTNVVDSAGFELYASLTSIPTASMYTLTGSGLTDAS